MRRVSAWVVPAIVAATVLSLGLGGVAQASRHVSPSVKKPGANRIAAVPSHRLLRTDFAGGYFGATAPAGVFTAIDSPQALNCPAAKAPCTIEASIGVEYGDDPAIVLFAECLVIDGTTFDNNGCAWAGPPIGSGYYNTPVQEQIATVAAGHHTVQTMVRPLSADASVYYYTFTYRIYW